MLTRRLIVLMWSASVASRCADTAHLSNNASRCKVHKDYNFFCEEFPRDFP